MYKTEAKIERNEEGNITLEATVPESVFAKGSLLNKGDKKTLWISEQEVHPADPKDVLNELLARASE